MRAWRIVWGVGLLAAQGSLLQACGESELAGYTEASASSCDVATRSEIIETGTDQYRVEQEVALDAPIGKVWAQLGDLEKFFSIALPDAEDIRWVSGNGKAVGDELNFGLGGGLIRLGVVVRDERAHRFDYRLLQPSLGIEQLSSSLRLERCGHGTRLVWVRDFRMAAGESFDGLRVVVGEEFGNLIDRFAP